MHKRIPSLLSKLRLMGADIKKVNSWLLKYSFNKVSYGYINMSTGYISGDEYRIIIPCQLNANIAFMVLELNDEYYFTATTKYHNTELFKREYLEPRAYLTEGIYEVMVFIDGKLLCNINLGKSIIQVSNLYGEAILFDNAESLNITYRKGSKTYLVQIIEPDTGILRNNDTVVLDTHLRKVAG